MTRQPQYSWTLFPVLAVCLLSAAQTSNQPLPPVMHFCAYNCMTLILQDGHYVVTAESGVKMKDGRTVTGTWTVESFSTDSVILRRVDATGFTGVYKGQISKDGNRLVNITLDGHRDPKMRLTWGTALNETPGSNAERDRMLTSQGTPGPSSTAPSAVQQPGVDGKSGQETSGGANSPVTASDVISSYAGKTALGEAFLNSVNPYIDHRPFGADRPTRLAECENTHCNDDGMALWNFHGKRGTSLWTFSVAKLDVVSFDGVNIVIHRVDLPGTYSAGMTAVYTGKLKGSRFDGTVIWDWPAQWGKPVSSPWYATVLPVPIDEEVADWEFNCIPVPNHPESIQFPMNAAAYYMAKKDMSQAFCWEQDAAIGRGDARAAHDLAVFYAKGDGVPQNIERAWKWTQIANNNGFPLPPEVTKAISSAVTHKETVEQFQQGLAVWSSIYKIQEEQRHKCDGLDMKARDQCLAHPGDFQ